MKTTISHKCGHDREYDFDQSEVAERSEFLSTMECPSCAAREFTVKRMEHRIEDAFNRRKHENQSN